MKSKLTWLLAILLFSCLIGNAQPRKNQTNNLPVLFSSVSVIQRNQRIDIFYKGSDSGFGLPHWQKEKIGALLSV